MAPRLCLVLAYLICQWTHGISTPCDYKIPTIATCSKRSLSSLPLELLDNTTFLDAADNDIVIVPSNAFTGKASLTLTSIDLSGNKIVTVTKDSFSPVVNLRSVILDSNKIQYLHPDTFKYNLNLVGLFLRYNRFTLSGDEPFLNLPTQSVSLLLIVGNIEKLESKTFENAPNMETLSLDNNKIASIKSDTFQNLPNLKSLELSSNKIESLERDVFRHLTSLVTLKIVGNKLRTLDKDLLKNTTQLSSLYLNDNQLRQIPDELFSALTLLDTLYLSSNKLQSIGKDTFSSLINLRLLNIKANFITEIDSNLFHNLGKLTYLNLNKNHIYRLGNKTFSNLHNLRDLDISENSIWIIEKSTFESLQRLESLNMDQNGLIMTHADMFSTLTKLQSLILCRNSLHDLGDNIFKKLSSLKMLRLCDNDISVIDEQSFKHLKNLETLDLSSNRLETLHNNTFVYLQRLQKLDLHNNRLSDITNLFPAQLHNLLELHLYENQIDAIECRQFEHLKNLNHIDFSANNLRCDCQLHDVWTWCAKKQICTPLICYDDHSEENEFWDDVMRNMKCEPKGTAHSSDDNSHNFTVTFFVQDNSKTTNQNRTHIRPYPVNIILNQSEEQDTEDSSHVLVPAIISVCLFLIVVALAVAVIIYRKRATQKTKKQTVTPHITEMPPSSDDSKRESLSVSNSYYSMPYPNASDFRTDYSGSIRQQNADSSYLTPIFIRKNTTEANRPQLPIFLSRNFPEHPADIHATQGNSGIKMTHTSRVIPRDLDRDDRSYVPRGRENWLKFLDESDSEQDIIRKEFIYSEDGHYEKID